MIEYGRTLHAEMDAITSAARKGVSTRGATLYCTTMPCHECARLIIGAGIKRVLFIEPYEKSRALALYATEIRLTSMSDSLDSDSQLVDFIPYMGVSPRRFADLFSPVPRKLDDAPTDPKDPRPKRLDGAIVEWNDYRKTTPIRETIVSDSAFVSVSRLFDKLIHEYHTIFEYEQDYEAATGVSRNQDGLVAPAKA